LTLGFAVLSVAGGITVLGITAYLNKHDDAYRFEAQMALITLRTAIEPRVWPDDPAPLEKIRRSAASRVGYGLQFDNGTFISEDDRYEIDFVVESAPTYIDERGVESLRGYTLRATAINPDRNPCCQWHTLDGLSNHGSGPAPDCWFLQEYADSER
jgi:hypothetical protein